MSATTTLKAEREARKAKRAADKAAKLQALADAEQAAKTAMTPPPQPRQLGCGADALLGSHPHQSHPANTAQAQERRQALPPHAAHARSAQLGPRALQPGSRGTDGRCSMNRPVTDTLINCALALGIVAIYAAMQQLEAPADRRAEWAESEAAQLAIKNEAARARFAQAAAQMCGNADYLTLDDKTIQCLPRKGPANSGAVLQVAEAAQ